MATLLAGLRCPAQPRAADTIVSGLATALIASTPYLSPGVVGPWCQHSAPSVILLITGSFTWPARHCWALGHLSPALFPLWENPSCLAACATPSVSLLLSQPWSKACRKYLQLWPASSASVSTTVSQGAKWGWSLQAKVQSELRRLFYVGKLRHRGNRGLLIAQPNKKGRLEWGSLVTEDRRSSWALKL